MSTTLAIRFPLGRYHANPWNRAVNEGATEWPPSPWRILRALLATWHTRWPDLPGITVDGLLDALADPPCYRAPWVVAGHTRHYLPDLEHRKGEPGHTDLTLDPFLSIAADQELLVRWDAELGAEQRQVLGKLAELLPYLGRSESACEARLLDAEAEPDETWWCPDAEGQTRLLAVTRPVSREELEVTTTDVRKSRRTMPPGTRWVNYAPGNRVRSPTRQLVNEPRVEAIRFAIAGAAPMKATHGVLLADRAHEVAGTLLDKAGIPDDRRQKIMGTRGAGTDHAHAHWIALPDSGERGASVLNLVVWVPGGLRTKDVQALLSLREMSGRRGDYEVSGFPEVKLLFQAAGPVAQVAPELCGQPSRVWISRTPYLPVRHRKRETLDDFLAADVSAELRYRSFPTATVTRLDPGSAMTDRWASEFRRRRIRERLSRFPPRPGMGLRLEFAEPVTGPLLLGQLSHFGYGIFVPDRD